MSKLPQKILFLLILFLSFPVTDILSSGQNSRWRHESVLGNPSLSFDSAKVPLGFKRNKVQVLGKASAYSKASGSTPQLTNESDELWQYTAGRHVLGYRKGEMFIASGDHALKVEFVNARPVSPGEEIKSLDPAINRGATQPLGKVSYHDLWDGVTLVYEKHGSGVVKSTYYIQPAGTGDVNPVDQIRLRYNVPLKVEACRDLLLSFATGEMRESRPVAWQEIKGKRVPVEVTYRLTGEQEVGFKSGSYDPQYSLVIDPVLSWNTFLGSQGNDSGDAIAVDASGNIYVAGASIATWGTPVRAFAGSEDAFVAKLNANGELQWNTFLGGLNSDKGQAIAVDANGNVYVAGTSWAAWGNPVNSYTGNEDAFVVKLNGSNGILQWNTFLGSYYYDRAWAVAVDTSGNVYVTGNSVATWGSPILPYAGIGDAFVAKLNGSGVLQWNTFLGKSGFVQGRAIALDASGNVYVAGWSEATWGSPVNPFTGFRAVFVAKLSGSGVLQWNTFLGSSLDYWGQAIAVDTSGNVYVTGTSETTWGTPINPFAGYPEVFVAKLNGSNGILQWNTFLGAAIDDYGNAIAVDGSGNVYVAGTSYLLSWGSPFLPFAGETDAFVAKLNGSGALQWNAFLGSSSDDFGNAIAVDTSGNVYVAGSSYASWGSPVRPSAGGTDAFVVKIATQIKSNIKNDFNGDGQEDILWRYYGPGGYNCVWFMGTSGGAGAGLQTLDSKVINLSRNPAPDRIYRDAREAVEPPNRTAHKIYSDAREAGGSLNKTVDKLYWDARESGGFRSRKGALPVREGSLGNLEQRMGIQTFISPMENMIGLLGIPVLGGANLPAVADVNWHIDGTGDFNGDGNVDILWRYYGPGGYSCVWFMNGTTIIGGANLPAVTDLNWTIAGTGDFNGDSKVDILWRYYGSGGYNCVWFMNGTTVTGGANLPAIADLNWTIAGTGDFNGDAKVDILWRYYGSSGYNCVWFMIGTTITGGADLPPTVGLSWQIAGTGDFNGDGYVDILWRYYGSGYNCVWFMIGMTIIGGADIPACSDLNWKIVSH